MIKMPTFLDDVLLTADLDSLAILTDREWLDVRISAAGPVLECRYYAFDGLVRVSDLGSLLESHLAGNVDFANCDVTIEAAHGEESATAVLNVLYCDRNIGIKGLSAWLADNFLTLNRSRRIAPEADQCLWWYAREGERITFMVKVQYLDPDGAPGTEAIIVSANSQVAKMDGLCFESFRLADIAREVATRHSLHHVTLQTVTAQVGERSLTLYVDPSLSGLVPMHYLNCFGLPEHLALPGKTVAKTKTDRSVATLGRSAQFYDITTSKEYEVETGPLTADDCIQAEQMLASPCVRIALGEDSTPYDSDFDALTPILITDYTAELAQSPNKPNKLKFTWRFADTRTVLAAPTTPGIFTHEYNRSFN